jgi:hypothetical protein
MIWRSAMFLLSVGSINNTFESAINEHQNQLMMQNHKERFIIENLSSLLFLQQKLGVLMA